MLCDRGCGVFDHHWYLDTLSVARQLRFKLPHRSDNTVHFGRQLENYTGLLFSLKLQVPFACLHTAIAEHCHSKRLEGVVSSAGQGARR